jgi:hypothetical protein
MCIKKSPAGDAMKDSLWVAVVEKVEFGRTLGAVSAGSEIVALRLEALFATAPGTEHGGQDAREQEQRPLKVAFAVELVAGGEDAAAEQVDRTECPHHEEEPEFSFHSEE